MKLFFFAPPQHESALEARKLLVDVYGHHTPEESEAIVVLGGDGTMLHVLHDYMKYNKPFFGMNLGTVGFLMNTFQVDGLRKRLQQSLATSVAPLMMEAECVNGQCCRSHAFNEVSLLRQTHQAAKMRLWLDGVVRLKELIADGILVATAAGSTAYNLSNKGPILPLNSGLLVLTPISPFRPRHWQSVLLKEDVDVTVEILSPKTRPVSASADFIEARSVRRVHIKQDKASEITLLFDPDGSLEERILQEQFHTYS